MIDFDDDDEDDEFSTVLRGPVGLGHNALARRTILMGVAGKSAGRIVTVEKEAVVGRSNEASLQVTDDGVSRLHARFFARGGMLWVEDLGSTNGTILNGTTLEDGVPVADGDHIQIGACELIKLSVDPSHTEDLEEAVCVQAFRDPRTGIYRSSYLNERLTEEISYVQRRRVNAATLSIGLADTEGLVRRVGPLEAEHLRTLAGAVAKGLRTEDLISRSGPMLLGVLLRDTSGPEAVIVSQRILSLCNSQQDDIGWWGPDCRLVIGVACCPDPEVLDGSGWLARAHAARETAAASPSVDYAVWELGRPL